LNGWVSLGVLVAAASVLLALLCAVALAIILRFAHDWLQRAAMKGRVGVILMLTVAPMLANALILTLALAPSALAAGGLISDHCLTSFHDHLHLCVTHLPTIGPGYAAWAVTSLGALAFGAAMWTALRTMAEARRVYRSLSVLAHRDGRDGVGWIDSPASLSLTAGLLRPRVFISSGFAHTMDELELDAAIAHERCHARERHGLLKLIAFCGSLLHLPSTRRTLLANLTLACERRADESAATEVGDRMSVASAILRAHRAASPAALVFGLADPTTLERRVQALLAPPTPSFRGGERRWILAITVIASAASIEVHHAVEVAMSLLV